jgi:hypothetical protein
MLVRSGVDTFTCVVWADFPDLAVGTMNETARRVFGDVRGRPLRAVCHERGVGWAVDLMERAIDLGHIIEYDLEWLGSTLHTEIVPVTTGISLVVTGPAPHLPALEAARLELEAEGADGPCQRRRYRWGRLLPASGDGVRAAA